MSGNKGGGSNAGSDSDRRELLADVSAHARKEIEFLMTVYRWAAGGVSLIIAVGLAVGAYFYGSTVRELQDQLGDVRTRVEERITDEFRQERITRLVEEKAVQQVAAQLEPRLAEIQNIAVLQQERLAALDSLVLKQRQQTDHITDIIDAQSGSREAFDRLCRVARSGGFLSENAENVLSSIARDYRKRTFTDDIMDAFNITALRGVSIDEIRSRYDMLTSPDERADILSGIDGEDYGETRPFLFEVLKKEPHLLPLSVACRKLYPDVAVEDSLHDELDKKIYPLIHARLLEEVDSNEAGTTAVE